MTAALTLDLDAVRHYHAIHGLPPPTGDDPILRLALPRLQALLDDDGRDARATVFVVGADLSGDVAGGHPRALASRLSDWRRRGHEVASHSHAHDYALSRASRLAIAEDLARSIEAIEAAVGARPRGFRAPGYNLSPALIAAIADAGFAWDSSVMRSPAYFVARAAAIAAHRLAGRRSSSLVGRVGDWAPWPLPGVEAAEQALSARGVRELAISTWLGAPWIGTTVAHTAAPLARAQATAVHLMSEARQALRGGSAAVVLELHGIDLCDADDGFDAALVSLQADLRVPWPVKRARLSAALTALPASLTMSAMAATVDGDGR